MFSANEVHNTIRYEKTILSEVCCHDLETHQAPNAFVSEHCAILGAKPVSERVFQICVQSGLCDSSSKQSLLMGSQAKLLPAGVCAKSDIVLIKQDANLIVGRVLFHVSLENDVYTLVEPFELKSYDKVKAIAVWLKSQRECFIKTLDVLCPLVFSVHQDTVRTLLPLQHRLKLA